MQEFLLDRTVKYFAISPKCLWTISWNGDNAGRCDVKQFGCHYLSLISRERPVLVKIAGNFILLLNFGEFHIHTLNVKR